MAHPFGVAVGEIVVDRDDVDALALKRIEVDRRSRHQRFTFAGAHLGDGAGMQHHAADQLHVEMPQAQCPLRRLTDRGEGLRKDVGQAGAVGDLLTKFLGPFLQRLVREGLRNRFQRIDSLHQALEWLELAIIDGTKEFLGDSGHSDLSAIICAGTNPARIAKSRRSGEC